MYQVKRVKKLKVAFYTLGCKVNQYETSLIKEKFEEKGYDIVDDNEIADIYLINTCTVTNMSDRKTRQVTSRMRKQNSNAIIGVLGCYAQSLKDDKDKIDADCIIGNDDKNKIVEMVENCLENKAKTQHHIIDISREKKYKKQGVLEHGYEVRENIKIEDGCNNFCSYCIIPYVRGRVRSRDIQEIIKEAENLAQNNVKEIVLVGIEVASYGQDIQEKIGLIDVIQKVSEVKGIERIRISSIEPRFLTKENILRLSKIEKFCEHFHISMQSGNDNVLKRMNRKYTKNDLIEICHNIYEIFSNATISVDCIVGFPGETEEEFKDTVDTIQKMNLMKLHVFKYSKRNYTVAAKMENQIDGSIKKQRSNELLDISRINTNKFLSKYIGKELPVLFESYSNGYLYGYTKNYIMCKVRGDESLCGTIQDVVLTSLETEQMLGTIN